MSAIALLHTHEGENPAFVAWLQEHLPWGGALWEMLWHSVTSFLEIFLLLLAVLFLVSFLQTYLPVERMRQKLSALRGPAGMAVAILLGVLSPLCSCTVIPLLMGFVAIGVPLTFCFTFITAASALNMSTLVGLFALYPRTVALPYGVCALLLCVLVPLAVRRFASGETQVRLEGAASYQDTSGLNLPQRLVFALVSALDTISHVWYALLFSVVLSEAILTFVSDQTLSTLLTGENPITVVVAVCIGALMLADVYSMAPVVQVIAGYSTAIPVAFMLSGMLVSIPQVTLMAQTFSHRLVRTYALVVAVLSLVCGVILALLF